MNSLFTICKSGSCGVTITGIERESSQYLTDSTITSLKTYTFAQSVTVNAITHITFDGTETLDKYGVVLHSTNDIVDESTFETSMDGLYRVTHIILPNETWLALAISLNSLGIYTNIYYYNTTTSKFMKYSNNTSTEATIEEILGINATDATTIVKAEKNTFTMCRLKSCFYKYCRGLLDVLPIKCKSKDYENSIYTRDLIWMAINCIQYLLDQSQYYAAEELLEKVTGCNGLCKDSSPLPKTSNDCGCSN